MERKWRGNGVHHQAVERMVVANTLYLRLRRQCVPALLAATLRTSRSGHPGTLVLTRLPSRDWRRRKKKKKDDFWFYFRSLRCFNEPRKPLRSNRLVACYPLASTPVRWVDSDGFFNCFVIFTKGDPIFPLLYRLRIQGRTRVCGWP